MSIEWILSSCVLILFIILIRSLFGKKISSRVRYALWLIVAFRLLLPISFSQTAFSVLNLLPEEAAGQNVPDVISFAEPNDLAVRPRDVTIDGGKTVDIEIDGAEAEQKAKPDELEKPDKDIKERMDIFRCLWLIGIVTCAAIFFLANLDYSRRLKRSRKRIADENLPVYSAIPVYETEIAASPCLFGLFYPAVYVTKCVAEDEKKFVFVLSHENTHYRHRDNWWALLRILCVCLHWYNPLVWVGAYLSKQDAELACDEETLENLGDEVRIARSWDTARMGPGKVWR